MAEDIFETENGIGIKPQQAAQPRFAARAEAIQKDRNLHRRVQRRMAKVNWSSVKRWYKRAQIHAVMRSGLGGYTGPV